jgi:murein DD-endopeptidase MepM/ murein hydrolase activator NlpD
MRKKNKPNMLIRYIKLKVKVATLALLAKFLPFILFFLAIYFAIMIIFEILFFGPIQADKDTLDEDELQLRNMIVEQLEYHNANDDSDDNMNPNWYELYTIMMFFEMSDATEITEELVSRVIEELKSTFTYKDSIVIIEHKIVSEDDENDYEWVVVSEETEQLLVEAVTLRGHFVLHYEEVVTEVDGIRTTRQEFANQEQIGEGYGLLRGFLDAEFDLDDYDLDWYVEFVIESSTGFHDNSYNDMWLAENPDFDFSIFENTNIGWPLPPQFTHISSHYGPRRHPIHGGWSFHDGIDLPAPQNTDVLAPVDGIIIRTFSTSANGNTIILRDSQFDFLFLHLHVIEVEPGQEVRKGQRIGRSWDNRLVYW